MSVRRYSNGSNEIFDRGKTRLRYGRMSEPATQANAGASSRSLGFALAVCARPPRHGAAPHAQLQRQDAARLHPPRQELCVISWPLARYRKRRRSAPFSTASTAERGTAVDHEQCGIGTALFLQRSAFVREPRKIPVILSPQEVGRLLEAAPGPKYKAAMSAAYSAGLQLRMSKQNLDQANIGIKAAR